MSNTLVTISDNKIGVEDPNATSDNLADFYEARVLSATDYYAFGMAMKERSWQSESYRYGFNGKEKDKDIGEEVEDFGERLQNSKIGRFFSPDRFEAKFPYQSTYIFAGNSPIAAIDINGDSLYIVIYFSGNHRGDDMFKAAALTRKYDIENSKKYDAKRDHVEVIEISDVSDIIKEIDKTVQCHSTKFGKTVEVSIWSHAGEDGPNGAIDTQIYSLKDETGNNMDRKQMSIKGWGQINFNWNSEGTCNLYVYGCGTGEDPKEERGDTPKASFVTTLSSLPNMKNVAVWGIIGNAFPSKYANKRNLSWDNYKDIYNIGEQIKGKSKVYLVGGEMSDYAAIISQPANLMRKSVNGKGVVKEGQYGTGDKDN